MLHFIKFYFISFTMIVLIASMIWHSDHMKINECWSQYAIPNEWFILCVSVAVEVALGAVVCLYSVVSHHHCLLCPIVPVFHCVESSYSTSLSLSALNSVFLYDMSCFLYVKNSLKMRVRFCVTTLLSYFAQLAWKM